jgi:hypothetical protein
MTIDVFFGNTLENGKMIHKYTPKYGNPELIHTIIIDEKSQLSVSHYNQFLELYKLNKNIHWQIGGDIKQVPCIEEPKYRIDFTHLIELFCDNYIYKPTIDGYS